MGIEMYQHFNVPELDAFIEESGSSVVVTRAILCPCQIPGEFSNPSCDLCGGIGWWWDEDNSIPTKALLSSDQFSKNRIVPGTWTTGEMNCTLPSSIHLGDFDKVTPVGERMIVNDEVLVKGDVFNGDTQEFLRHPGVIEVSILRDKQQEYIKDVDYSVFGQLITWIPGGKQPQMGVSYVARYTTSSVYVVWGSQPRIRIDAHAGLPWFARLLRYDIYLKNLP